MADGRQLCLHAMPTCSMLHVSTFTKQLHGGLSASERRLQNAKLDDGEMELNETYDGWQAVVFFELHRRCIRHLPTSDQLTEQLQYGYQHRT